MANPVIVITGASGLLGRALLRELGKTAWIVEGIAFQRVSDNLHQLDLTSPGNIERLFSKFNPTGIVHCAGERKPDVVEKNREKAHKLNVEATAELARQCAKHNCWIIYISTDYVFDGKGAPYSEADSTNPLNEYGRQKLDGEEAVLKHSTDSLVLRIPILYGDVEYLAESAVTVLLTVLTDRQKVTIIDNYQRRFPTHVTDISKVTRQIIDMKLQDSSLHGVLHWSSKEEMTKWDMVLTIAKTFSMPYDHLKPDDTPPKTGTLRPYNTQLSTVKLENMGIVLTSVPFAEGIKNSLGHYLKGS